MNRLHNFAAKLGMTKAEMTAVTLLTLFLLLGGALKFRGGVQQAELAIEHAETASFAEADVDSLLALALQQKRADETGALPSASTQAEQPRASNAKSEASAPKSATKRTKKSKLVGTIPFNTASAAQLQRISGIGPVMAKRLIEFRKQKGGKVEHFNDLLKVKGIGKKKLERLKKHLTLD